MRVLGKLILIGMIVGIVYRNRQTLLSLGILVWFARKSFGKIEWAEFRERFINHAH